MHVGLDTAVAPSVPTAKAMLDAVHGDFWLVYLPSGTRNGGSGWTPDLIKAYAAAGITQFLPCWVGNQILPAQGIHDALTAELGHTHGMAAVADMQRFGWTHGCPVALDEEYSTAQEDLNGSVAYADGWCVAVRDGGYVPGVYAPLFCLVRLWAETNRPDFAYAADWVRTGVDPAISPDHIPGVPDADWQHMRVWQYSNSVIGGINVDINVADFPLAPAPGVPVDPPPTAADYEAAARVAHVYSLSSHVPVRSCQGRWQQIAAYVKSTRP